MATVLLGAGLALALALLVAIHRKLDDLVPRLAAVARRERDEGRAQALDVLSEAAAVKVAVLTMSLQRHEEEIAEVARAQIAAAEVRARLVEQQSSKAGVALSAASDLVRQVAEVLHDARVARPVSDTEPPAPVDADARATVELRPTPLADAEDDDTEEELTKVAPRPLLGAAEAPNGLRLVRATIAPPARPRPEAREAR